MFWRNVVKCYGNVAVTFFENVLKCVGALSARRHLTLLHLIKHYNISPNIITRF